MNKKEKLFTVGTRINETLDNRVGILAMKHKMTTSEFVKNALIHYCNHLELNNTRKASDIT